MLIIIYASNSFGTVKSQMSHGVSVGGGESNHAKLIWTSRDFARSSLISWYS